MKLCKISCVTIILVLFGFFINFVCLPTPIQATPEDYSEDNNLTYDSNCILPEDISPEDLVILDTFPVELYYLFWEDNHTHRDELLSLLETEQYGWIISPWGGYFTGGHVEGADKWYITPYRQLEIRGPCDGAIYDLPLEGETIGIAQGNEVVLNSAIDIDIGNDCGMNFGHIDLLKTIYDEFEATGNYTFTEGELVGYTHNHSLGYSGFDFYYSYKAESICPLPALKVDLQSEVIGYYDLQYEHAKIGGLHPQTDICLDMNIHIEDTLWAVWEYEEGPYDSYIESLEEPPEAFFCNFFNMDFANPETFWRDPTSQSKNITDDIAGVMRDGVDVEIPDYDLLDVSFVKSLEGDYSNGILEMRIWWGTNWGPGNTTIYAKFSIDAGSSGYKDDILTIEYFDNLNDAQAGFTAMSMTYKRYRPYWETGVVTDGTGMIGFSKSILIVGVAISFIALVVRRKKTKLKGANKETLK